MITRETKVGLVVACSFLCLVGVVLAGKYTNLLGTPPASEADQVVASNDKPPPEKKERKATGKENSTQAPLETLSPEATPNLEPTPPVVQTGGTDLESLPPLPPAEKTNTTKTDDKNPDSLPPLEPKEGTKDAKPVMPPLTTDAATTDETETKRTERTEKPAPIIESTEPKKDDGDKLPPLPGEEPVKKTDSKPPADVTIDLPPPPALKKNKPDSPTSVAPVPDTMPEPSDTALPTNGGKKKVPAIALPGKDLSSKETFPPPPPVKNPDDTELPDNTKVAMGKPVPGVPGESPRPAPRAEEPARQGSSATGSPASRVPSRPAAGSVPRVESFDEETYRPRQDDNFASISKRYYQSDKYAQALLLFNREHPRAGDGVRRDPPVLAGQPVYIPPIHVLERRHGDAIEGYVPPRSAAPPSNPTPVGRDVPRRREDSTPSGQAGPAGTTPYQVSPNGETMMEIARTKLRNGERWREIDKLNPGWRPDYPIPGGTTLRLPADVRGTP